MDGSRVERVVSATGARVRFGPRKDDVREVTEEAVLLNGAALRRPDSEDDVRVVFDAARNEALRVGKDT